MSCCCSVIYDSSWPHGLQHNRLPCPSLCPGVCTNSCPLSQWCHPTISSSVIPFSSCTQSFLGIRVFSNESVFCIRWPKYWSFSISPSSEYLGLISFRVELTGLIFLQFKGFSRVFSNAKIWKHQSSSAQPSLWSKSHIHTWLLEKL